MTKTLRLASALGLALLANCTKPNPAACDGDYCPTKALPFCDSDGALEGAPGTCIPVDCTPGDFVSCRGDQAIVCNTAGTNYDLSHCDLGCDPTSGCVTQVIACTPGEVRCGDRTVERCGADGVFSSEACDVSCIDGATPHCSYLEPKYLPDICDTVATEDHLELGPINTSTDQLCNGGIVTQMDGPDICVLRYKTISLAATAGSKVTGGRVLALVADESVDLAGTLDLSADGTTSGPGGGLRRSGGAAALGVGGGGAGFGMAGGSGGNSTTDGGASNFGSPFDALTSPVVAGGARSTPGSAIHGAPTSGGAGGAALVIACRGAVTVSGLVDAGGGGGDGGTSYGNTTILSNGGAGGGSGGFVVLQGMHVAVPNSAKFYANGGGGGNGKTTYRGNGAPGGDGERSSMASRVAPLLLDEGAGGAGGYNGGTALSGHRPNPSVITNGTQSVGSAGGGGGSTGAFQVYTPAGVFPVLTPADASPKLQPGLSVPVR